ncbi:hypothetical protein LUZ60_006998 [Juncus effusus]|nr:hypothetical protein LUZ60_006998 [Juncus effusus]
MATREETVREVELATNGDDLEAGRSELRQIDVDLHDDDGRAKRTGTIWTATAHIITAVIGSGVLSLAWAMSQLGWVAGPLTLICFSLITLYTSCLLANCYRTGDPVTGKRNYTYRDAVKSYLGKRQVWLCILCQYLNLFGTTIGYTITASISAALSIARLVSGNTGKTTLTGTELGVDVNSAQKIWMALQSLGNIAFAYSFSMVLIEIQNTLKSSPAENKVMKKASLFGVTTTTTFYLLSGLLGYAAFGNRAPGNILMGFYEPYWLVGFANVCIVVHLVGAYQRAISAADSISIADLETTPLQFVLSQRFGPPHVFVHDFGFLQSRSTRSTITCADVQRLCWSRRSVLFGALHHALPFSIFDVAGYPCLMALFTAKLDSARRNPKSTTCV